MVRVVLTVVWVVLVRVVFGPSCHEFILTCYLLWCTLFEAIINNGEQFKVRGGGGLLIKFQMRYFQTSIFDQSDCFLSISCWLANVKCCGNHFVNYTYTLYMYLISLSFFGIQISTRLHYTDKAIIFMQ